jgi:hypothetical protein
MQTECEQGTLEFQGLKNRAVEAAFDGGRITSDGGGLLLREVDGLTGIIGQFAACFADHRNPEFTEHTKEELVAQRVYALALGYEDVNDHDRLRHDTMLGVLAGKADPTGEDRIRKRDRGKACAGKSTLNRLELTPKGSSGADRYKKIVLDEEAVNRFFVEVFLQAHGEAPKRIILDLDATDDPVHGNQEGRFFHGYYDQYCYLPLYIFCGDDLLCARLRPSNIDASAGSKEELERIVAQIRARWPEVEIWIRGDSGFCREELMAWCEGQSNVHYIFAMAKNSRLVEEIEAEMGQARQRHEETSEAARVFKDFSYQTRESWSRARRMVAKAEHLAKGANPRFVVTSLGREFDARTIYEDIYCARGEMENRIKEQQMDLFADRTSTAHLWSNQVRLWLSSVAYTLMQGLRRLGLQGTEMARATCGTIRTKLLKIGGSIKLSVRRVRLALAGGYPFRELFTTIYNRLRQWRPLRC